MKKILYIVLFMIMFGIPASAETMAVQSVSSISTAEPSKIIKVKVIRDCRLGDVELKIGYILEGKILNVIDPKRLKKDASFTFYPTYYNDLNGQKFRFSKVYVGEYSSKFEINPVKLAKSAVLTVGNHFVKGISTGYYALEGAVQNESGNRVGSAVHNVYENSMLSYVEKGKQLEIPEGVCFGLKFDDCENSKEDLND